MLRVSNPVEMERGKERDGPLLISSLDKAHSEKLKGNGTTPSSLGIKIVEEASSNGKNTINFELKAIILAKIPSEAISTILHP